MKALFLHLFVLFGLVALASPMSVTFTATIPEGHLVTVRSWAFGRAGADLCNVTADPSSSCKLSHDFIALLRDGDGKIVATADPFSKWWGGTSYANATLDIFVPRLNGTASGASSYLPMKRGLAHMLVGLSAGFVNTSGYDGHYWCNGFSVFSYNSDPSITRTKLCDALQGPESSRPCLVREDFTVEMHCCTCCGGEDGSKRRRGGNKSNVNPDTSRAVSGPPESGRGAGRRHLLQGRIECSYGGPASDPFSVFWGDQGWMTASGIAYSANNPNGGSYVELQKEDGTHSIAV